MSITGLCENPAPHDSHDWVMEWTGSEHGCDGSPESCSANCPVPVLVQQQVYCPGRKAHRDVMIGRLDR